MIDEPTPKPTVAVPTPPIKNPAEIAKSTDFYLLIGIMAGVLFLGAIVIWCVDRWRKRQDRDDTPSLSLSNFRAMFENGEITQAEYGKILVRMAPKIKGTPTATAPPLPPTPPPPAPPVFPKSE